MASPGPFNRGTPLPRHVWRLGLLGGADPRHSGAHSTVLYRHIAHWWHIVQPERCRDCLFPVVPCPPRCRVVLHRRIRMEEDHPSAGAPDRFRRESIPVFSCSQFCSRSIGGGTLTSLSNLYGRPAASVGTPSSRCGTTAPSLLPSQYGRRPIASSSQANRKPNACALVSAAVTSYIHASDEYNARSFPTP